MSLFYLRLISARLTPSVFVESLLLSWYPKGSCSGLPRSPWP